jgi:GTP-binding protein
VEIASVTFRAAALTAADRPAEPFPHVVVAGRSNVGKSSLLNWLFRRDLARVAKAPGKTRTVNFYLINRNVYFVDLPGYGYAKVGRDLREQWGAAINAYLSGDDRIAGVVCLVDIRHGPTPLDLDLQELLTRNGRRREIVLTKADKVGRGQQAAMQHRVRAELGLPSLPLAVSVTRGEGRGELLARIDSLATSWRSSERRQ